MTEEITKNHSSIIKILYEREINIHKKVIHHQKILPDPLEQRQDDGHSCPLCHVGPLGTKPEWQEGLTWDHRAQEKIQTMWWKSFCG